MLRNIVRTTRRLPRRKINTLPLVLQCHNSCIRTSPCSASTHRHFASQPNNPQYPERNIDPAVFEEVCSETLESLCEFFEELIEDNENLKGADVTYSDGVLTVDLGRYGTYVINRQSPNKQIWLSSPVSGPKRYDLVIDDGGYWIYKHDGISLHQLLYEELTKVVDNKINIEKCAHSFNIIL